MSVTTHSDRCLHPNYFVEPSYCRHLPPSKVCFWTRYLQWRRRRQWQPILQRQRNSIPSSCRWRPTRQNWPGLIIRQRHADSARRWEHLRDLASTSLWPSTARLSSTLQPLGNIGISLIDSSVPILVSVRKNRSGICLCRQAVVVWTTT